MAKTLRVRSKAGWVTKPPLDTPGNSLTAQEVDDNFLGLEGDIESLSATITPREVVVEQSDIGTAPNQVPLNQYLGTAAFIPADIAQDYTSDGWRDLSSPLLNAGAPTENAPSMTNFTIGAYTRREFAFSVGNYLYAQPFHINHDMKVGGNAFLHVHWTTNGTNTNPVRWRFDLVRAKGHNQQAFTVVAGIEVTQAASGIAYQHMIAEATTPLIITEPDELILVTLTRIANGATENTDTVFGLMVDIHYETNRHSTPNKSPNFYGA